MKSIRGQLTRRLALGMLLIAGCGGAAAYLTMRTAVLSQFDEALLGKARAVSALTIRDRKGRPRLEEEDTRALGFTSGQTGHFYQLRTTDGKNISLSGAELPRVEDPGNTPEFKNIMLPDGTAGRAVSFAFIPRAEDEDDDDDEKRSRRVPASAVIVVASDRRPLDSTLNTLLAALGLSTGLLIASSWMLVPRVLRRGLRPLDELADRVIGITADSLSTRFPETGTPAEIQPIASGLNGLLERIEASFDREKRFSADLAQELRTPLAELRSQAELALKWPDARAATADADALAIALRMEHLVTRLLALARAEGGHAGAAFEEVMLEPAVLAAWSPFAKRAAARILRVDFRIPTGLAVQADPALLREILTNLFSNAADYTPEGGTVETEASLTEKGPSLRVTNSVEGLDTGDVGKLFDRFWRKETARSESEHAGLGLALARSHAFALGWRLDARLDDASRLTFTLDCGTP